MSNGCKLTFFGLSIWKKKCDLLIRCILQNMLSVKDLRLVENTVMCMAKD
jgi:hypothetical protein